MTKMSKINLYVGYDEREIYQAICTGLYENHFRELCIEAHSPYGEGGAGNQISNILLELTINKRLLQKKMTY